MTINYFKFTGLGDLGVLKSTEAIPSAPQDPVGGISTFFGKKSVVSDIGPLDAFADPVNEGKKNFISDFEVVPLFTPKASTTKESSLGPFSTLFSGLDLKAVPYYNFFVEDEERNEGAVRGNRRLLDLPRYVHLRWKQAPITDKPPIFKKAPPTTKRIRGSSLKVDKPILSDVKRGMKFDRRKANEFSVVREAVANGFISPGTISSVVELPLVNVGFDVVKPTPKVDEQLYLCSERTNGISIHDIQANINSLCNGILNATRVGSSVTSKKIGDTRKELFDGRFSVSNVLAPKRSPFPAFSSFSGLMIRGTAGDSPIMSLNMLTAHQSTLAAGSIGDQPEEEIAQVMFETVPVAPDPAKESLFAEVFFVDTAITGLVDEAKVDQMLAPEHAENMMGLSPYIPNLCVLSDLEVEIPKKPNIPSFPATQEESGTEYVGYVIEKYKQGDDGVFVLFDEIEIPDVGCTEFVDTRVLYGGVYRYRIKSILRWTRKGNVTHSGFEEGNFFDDDFSQTKKLATHKSSYFESEWNRNWQYAAIMDTVEPGSPDEFTVRPESHRKRVVVTWKVPYDPQRDLHYFVLYKKTQDGSGKDLSDWIQLDVRIGARNNIYFDNDVEFFQDSRVKYVYAAQTVTRHDERSLLSCQRAVRLNAGVKLTGEYPIEQVSGEGVRLDAVGAFATNPVKRMRSEVKARDKMLLTSRQGVHRNPFLDKTFCVRIESLDAGQMKDIVVDMRYDNLRPEVFDQNNVVTIEDRTPPSAEGRARNIFDAVISVADKGLSADSSADRGRGKFTFVSKLFGTSFVGLK